MKILTILGTRPEIIRLSRIIPKLDHLTNHFVLHTGQNYDRNLNDVFFNDLRLRQPNLIVDSKSDSFAQQLSKILIAAERTITEFKPDKVLVLGDTNSGLTAFIAERMGIPVYHMEAGNRCHDTEVPEELNRRLIDSVSSVNLPYTYYSKQNLVVEGYYDATVTGNPIGEVIHYYQPDIDKSDVVQQFGVTPGGYALVTAHRAENVDNKDRLLALFVALRKISEQMPVLFSCHPRTYSKMVDYNVETTGITTFDPLGFIDFVRLEQDAKIILTDSGTVCEEACIFDVPCVTTRRSTERPETVNCGANKVAGVTTQGILDAFDEMIDKSGWIVPSEYQWSDVSDRVVQKILGRSDVQQ